MMLTEGYEMREIHRTLLARQRMYLLHNTRPTETLLSALLAREVLSMDMCDDVKSERTAMEKMARLLDLLPARGPGAFDGFCEALLESDHSHVAEYLKQLEATESFRSEITPHCIEMSEHHMEKFISIFKKSTPTVSRFAEQKFQLILDEQESHLKEKETEMRDLRTKLRMKELEVSQFSNFTNSCCEIVETLANEVQRDFLSKSFLKEEKKHIENMKYSVQDITGLEKTVQFYRDMQTLLTFLESHTGLRQKNGSRNGSSRPRTGSRSRSGKRLTLREKLKVAGDMIVEMIENMGCRPHVSGALLRMELEKLLRLFRDLNNDVDQVALALKASSEHKNKLESEIILLMHSNQEVRRIEREVKEKQTHISELTRNFNLLKRKGPGREHRKQLQQIHVNLQQKKLQLADLQKTLSQQIDANDQRLKQLLRILPDEDLDNENLDLLRSDTELTMGSSRLGTPDTLSLATNVMAAHKRLEAFKRLEEERRLREEEEAEEEAERQREKEKAPVPASGGGGGGGLLQRRKIKQGRVGELKAGEAGSPRKGVTRAGKPSPGGKDGAKPPATATGGPGPGGKKENGGIDLDSWVQQQQKQSKTEQLHKKLAEFTPKPTEDRTAELKRVLKNSSDEDTPRKDGEGGTPDQQGGGADNKSSGDKNKNGASSKDSDNNKVQGNHGNKGNNNNSSHGNRLKPGGQGAAQDKSPTRNSTTGGADCSPIPENEESTSRNAVQGQNSRMSSGSQHSGSGSGGVSSRVRKPGDDLRKSRESSTEKSGTGSSAASDPDTKSRKSSRTTPPDGERASVAVTSSVAVLDPGIPVTGRKGQKLDGEIHKKPQPQPLGRQAIPMGCIDIRLPSK